GGPAPPAAIPSAPHLPYVQFFGLLQLPFYHNLGGMETPKINRIYRKAAEIQRFRPLSFSWMPQRKIGRGLLASGGSGLWGLLCLPLLPPVPPAPEHLGHGLVVAFVKGDE